MNIAPLHTAPRVQRLNFISFGQEEKLPQETVEQLPEPEKIIPPVETVKPEPAISEKELRNARNEGHEQGYKEGFAAAEAKRDKESLLREEAIGSVLEVIASRITLAAEGHIAYVAGKERLMNDLVLAIARKVAGDAMKASPYAGVEEILRECLALILGEPKITIAVSGNLSAGLKQRIDSLRPLLPGFSGELFVEEDADLSDNDCRVEWKSGYGERDTAKLWSDIETIIARTRKS